jgi:hypothetical protein
MKSREQEKIILGDEYDELLKENLKEVLRELGGQIDSSGRGIGGSQEIDTVIANINGHKIIIEAETYIGLSISGDKEIVNNIAALTRTRMQ